MLFTLKSSGAALIAVCAFALTASAATAAKPSPGGGPHVRVFDGASSASAGARVCCQLPRARTAQLTTAKGCKARRGKVVPRTRCARRFSARNTKRVTMSQFRRILRTARPLPKPEWKYVPVRRFSRPDSAGNLTSKTPRGTLKEGVHCMGGKYYPCWCEGANTCNNFIAACVEVGGSLHCGEHNKEGQPTACSCYK